LLLRFMAAILLNQISIWLLGRDSLTRSEFRRMRLGLRFDTRRDLEALSSVP
jgi:hypothetical protein